MLLPRRHLGTLLSLAFVVACSDSGPVDPDDDDGSDGPLSASAAVTSTEIGGIGNAPSIVCYFTLSLDNDADRELRLRRLIFHMYAGPHRTMPVDSLVYFDVTGAFPDGEIAAGEENETHWWFGAAVPFEVRGEMLYRTVAGREYSAPFHFDCGPTLEEALETAVPSVFNPSITPDSDTIEAGQAVRFSFEATSDLGLWETWVVVSNDAYSDTTRFTESLRTAVSHDVFVDFGPREDLGTRLTFEVLTFDAALRGTAALPVVSGALIDTVPPTGGIRPPGLDSSVTCTPATCRWNAGDSLRFVPYGSDASGFGTVTIRFGDAFVDSATVESGSWVSTPDVAGEYAISGTVSDRHGNSIDVDMGVAELLP